MGGQLSQICKQSFLFPWASWSWAVLQWLLLRRYLSYAGVWIPLTALGWFSGILLFYLVWLAGFRAPVEWIATIALPVFGALVGGVQWLYLRRVIDRAGFWVLASIVGYGVIGIVTLGLFTSLFKFLSILISLFVIIGLALFILLRLNAQTSEFGRAFSPTDSLMEKRPFIWPGRLAMTLLVGLLLVFLFFAGSWVRTRPHDTGSSSGKVQFSFSSLCVPLLFLFSTDVP